MSTTTRALDAALIAVLLLAAGVVEARQETASQLRPAAVDQVSRPPATRDPAAYRTSEPGLPEQTLGWTPIAPFAERQDDCADGVVKDDGSLETAYGWVPSVIDGVYVQEFHIREFPSNHLQSVCICWIRTRQDTDISFDVVFYEDVDGLPAETPYASVPAVASAVPEGVASGGAFYEIDVSQVDIHGGSFYIGARWNPSVEDYFFICADHSPETEPVNVFFIDDRADEWASALETSDPMFDGHRAIMVRATAQQQIEVPVPALGPGGIAALALLVAAAGWILLTRR